MHRRSFVKAALWGAVLAVGVVAAAQANNPGVSIAIYSGSLSGISLGSWGSGKAERDDRTTLVGGESIKVTTQGLYQGARLDFRDPIDLGPAFENPKTYLRFQLRFTGAGSTQQNFDPLTGGTTTGAASPFTRMRFVLTMADGSQYELIRPIDIPPSDDPDAWVPVSFPILALRKAGKEMRPIPTGNGTRLTRIAVFGDKYEQFNLGEITVLTDETEIQADPVDGQTAVSINDLVTYAGSGSGGASTLRFTWDFDASDGTNNEDREGRVVQYYWRKPGTYKVTLTVHDVDGLKRSVTSTEEVEVFE